jgi:hypothetical protein
MSRFHVGVHFPAGQQRSSNPALYAARVDDLGFDSIWVIENLGSASAGLECLTTLGFFRVRGREGQPRPRARPCRGRATHRAYTADQVRAVLACQDPRNALATEIAWRAGLRAHELLTLRRSGEATAATHRRWSPERFAGRGGERYVVTGKGGLRREVLVPRDLAARLEVRRHRDLVTIRDRGIVYRQHYDLGGGNAWSKSFGEPHVGSSQARVITDSGTTRFHPATKRPLPVSRFSK